MSKVMHSQCHKALIGDDCNYDVGKFTVVLERAFWKGGVLEWVEPTLEHAFWNGGFLKLSFGMARAILEYGGHSGTRRAWYSKTGGLCRNANAMFLELGPIREPKIVIPKVVFQMKVFVQGLEC